VNVPSRPPIVFEPAAKRFHAMTLTSSAAPPVVEPGSEPEANNVIPPQQPQPQPATVYAPVYSPYPAVPQMGLDTELLARMHKVAVYVGKHGEAFLQTIVAKQGHNPEFAFLHPWSPLHAQFRALIAPPATTPYFQA
jgi:hypothetical protein